jgi:hypothetical protein
MSTATSDIFGNQVQKSFKKWSIPVVERIGASVVVRNDPSDMIVPPAAVTTMPKAQNPSKLAYYVKHVKISDFIG